MVWKSIASRAFACLCLMASVWPASVRAKTVTDTEKWFGPDGLAKHVSAEIDGRRVGLDAAVAYLVSEKYRQDLGQHKQLLISQTSSDSIPCVATAGRFRYRDRDPQRPLSPRQQWSAWEENSSRNLRWSHQGLSLAGCYLRDLGKGDRAAADALRELLVDWYEKNAVVDLPDPEFSWGDHTAAFRLRRTVAILLAMEERGLLDEEMAEILLKMAYSHTRILLEEPQIRMRGSNHAMDQAQALFVSGMAFPFLTYDQSVLKEAYKRATYEAEFLIAPDGVQTENSPAYHQWVPVKAFTLVNAMDAYLGRPVSKALDARMEGATRFATWIARPDGYLPAIGDTGHNAPIRFNPPAGVDRSLRDQFRFVRSSGKSGSAPMPGMAIFDRSGYFIFRNRWSKGRENDDIHLVFKCGMLSHGHRHNDDGNVVLYAFGSEWLSDAGMYGYESRDPKRAYAVSPQAHNVSIPLGIGVVGRMGHEQYRKHRNEWGLVGAYEGSGAHCKSYMYESRLYQRDLRIGRDGVRIIDEFSGGKSQFATLFRVPNDKSIAIDRNTGRVSVCSREGRCLLIDYSSDAIGDVVVSNGADKYGQSFDTTGYLKTTNVQTIRMLWKDGVQSSRYFLRFADTEFFPEGRVYPDDASAGTTVRRIVSNGAFRWSVAIAAALIAVFGILRIRYRTARTRDEARSCD